MPVAAIATPPEQARAAATLCLMCKTSSALPTAELCAPCQREFEGLSEKPCLAVLRFEMAQRAALQAAQRTEEQRLSELKALFASRSRFILSNSEDDEMLPISSSALRATARREVAQPANVAAKVKVHRSPRGTLRHKLEGLATSEAKHEAARAAMERRRRIRKGEILSSEEEEEQEDEEEQDPLKPPPFRRAVNRSRDARNGGPEVRRKPRHAVVQRVQQMRRNLAFCMGLHRRVGRDSAMFGLSSFLLKSILSVVDDILLDLGLIAEHSFLSPMGPSKATRGPVTALSTDPNTCRLFAGGEDGSIVVWNVVTGQQQQVLRGHSSAIQTLVTIVDQKSVLPATKLSERKGDIGVREFSSRGEEKRLEDLSHRISLLHLRFPDQSLESLERLLRYHRGDADAATEYIAAHVDGGGIQETRCVAAASSSPAGASSTRAVQPSIPRGASNHKSKKKQLRAERTDVAPIPPNECSFLLVSGSAQGVVVWSGKRSGSLSIRQRLHHVGGECGPTDSITALAGGGRRLPLLVCAGKTGRVHLWDLHAVPTGSTGLRHSMAGHTAPVSALAMPQHDQTAGESQLFLYSKASAATTTPSSAGAAEWLWCVSGCEDGTIRRWDLVRGITTHILAGHDSPVTSLALAPVRRSSSKVLVHEAVVTRTGTERSTGLGFWRLFSAGDANDACMRCWDSYECFSSATEAKNTPYRYDQGAGRALSDAQATASGSSRLLGHRLEVGAGVKSMWWVAPSLVGEGCGRVSGDADGAFDIASTDHAGWLCCTLTNQTVIALRATDCAGRGKITLGAPSTGGNLEPPVSSLVGIFRSTVANSRSRERDKLADPAASVVMAVPLCAGDCGDTQAAAVSVKRAVMVIAAVGDKMRIFTTTE